jgi:GNAT superfamily N-acetyltransferase
MRLTVRDATPGDAEAVERLSAEFVAYLRALGDPDPGLVSAERFARDGFGPERGFTPLVADAEGAVVGYLLHCPGYDVDRGGRVTHVVELFVSAAARRRGAGRALMLAAAEASRRSGARALLWTVYAPNADARAFYERLGARYGQELLMSCRPDSLGGTGPRP